MAAAPPPEEVHTVKGAVIGLIFALIVLGGLTAAAVASYDADSGTTHEEGDYDESHEGDDDSHGDEADDHDADEG